ncbi:TetR/AcrR family transcriptional regulator C-terminal domain-containing protein [Streptomyces sp. Agncl-13]|uniref:TetR/AcrR family transcriptional regulator C-terminal domain-containing protein n=1 Tax=Streptomyces sp. Agncl-13 TaxID=3400628 RepID=UPI003A89FE55
MTDNARDRLTFPGARQTYPQLFSTPVEEILNFDDRFEFGLGLVLGGLRGQLPRRPAHPRFEDHQPRYGEYISTFFGPGSPTTRPCRTITRSPPGHYGRHGGHPFPPGMMPAIRAPKACQ